MLTSFRLAALDMGLNRVSPHHVASRNQGAFSEMIFENQIIAPFARKRAGTRVTRPSNF